MVAVDGYAVAQGKAEESAVCWRLDRICALARCTRADPAVALAVA